MELNCLLPEVRTGSLYAFIVDLFHSSKSISLFLTLLVAIPVWVAKQFHVSTTDRDSVVGIATRYGLDGPGIESRWGRDFSHLSRPALGLTQPPVQWVPGFSDPHLQCRGLKLGRAVPLPTVKALVAYTGRTFTFTFTTDSLYFW